MMKINSRQNSQNFGQNYEIVREFAKAPRAYEEAERVASSAVAKISHYCNAHGIPFVPFYYTHEAPIVEHGQLPQGIIGHTVLTGKDALTHLKTWRDVPKAPPSSVQLDANQVLEAINKSRFDVVEGQISDKEVVPPRKPFITAFFDFTDRVLGN